ncbi:MAG TPA: NYN domain-containing protein [Fibrobacteria bacterium]|nr:NYN domain-containing protein [Fibrobacteria bacterium]
MRDTTTNVAIYWDFENLQASLVEKKGGPGAYGRTKYQAQEALIDIESIMEYAATFGVVSINRAYCNWQWYGKYREPLLHNGLELIQLFHPGASGKNGGDIKLCLDCTEDLMRFPHIDVVVVVGGDSDFLPVAQKIKAQGKMLVGIGAAANTNRHWAHSCHEFKFYEALILDDDRSAPEVVAPQGAAALVQTPAVASSQPVQVPQIAAVVDPDNVVMSRPEDLLRRAILRLSGKSNDDWVLKGSIRPMMKRLDPTFAEEQHGVKNFSAFMKKFEALLEVRAGRNDQEVRLRGRGDRSGARMESPAERKDDRQGGRDRRGDRHRDGRRDHQDHQGADAVETPVVEPVRQPEDIPVVVQPEALDPMSVPESAAPAEESFQVEPEAPAKNGRRARQGAPRKPSSASSGAEDSVVPAAAAKKPAASLKKARAKSAPKKE